jgi:transcriptional regulator with GAF, ATPase, and Fis domain
MSRIPGIDWKKEYPPPKPFINAKPARRGLRSKIQKRVMLEKMSKGEKPFTLTDKQESKRIKNVVAFKSNQRKASISKNIPLIKEALEKNGNIRKEAATYLNVKYSWLHKWMSQTKHIVDWSKEYPSPHTNIKK